MDFLKVFERSEDVLEFPTGTEIIREGEEGHRMYIVVSGHVNISLKNRIIGSVLPGEIVGEMALINSDFRSATATAKTDCSLIPIDQKSFKLLLEHVPDFAQHVIEVLATRLQIAYQATGSLSA
jgi:CRP-like cAMP-binding protein